MPFIARTRARARALLAGDSWEGRGFNGGVWERERNVRDVRGRASDAAPLWLSLNKCLVPHGVMSPGA